jgi:hypothetical protein
VLRKVFGFEVEEGTLRWGKLPEEELHFFLLLAKY